MPSRPSKRRRATEPTRRLAPSVSTPELQLSRPKMDIVSKERVLSKSQAARRKKRRINSLTTRSATASLEYHVTGTDKAEEEEAGESIKTDSSNSLTSAANRLGSEDATRLSEVIEMSDEAEIGGNPIEKDAGADNRVNHKSTDHARDKPVDLETAIILGIEGFEENGSGVAEAFEPVARGMGFTLDTRRGCAEDMYEKFLKKISRVAKKWGVDPMVMDAILDELAEVRGHWGSTSRRGIDLEMLEQTEKKMGCARDV